MLASPRYSGRQGSPVARTSGFTLIELLTVIAIIMILAGIVVGVQRGVYSSQANAKARAEISAIATALEQYKATYGTYPEIDNSATNLFDHLTGKTWTGKGSTDTSTRKAFIDVATMTPNDKKTPTKFIDPWREDYIYRYNRNTHGDYFFILLSKGPDKKGGQSNVNNFASSSAYFTTKDYLDDVVYGLENN